MHFANTVLMMKPACFGFNVQTAQSNYFQNPLQYLSLEEIQKRAEEEFINIKNKLINAGIQVICLYDRPQPQKPDAIFLNNWLSTHEDGTVFIYPMLTENRRAEKRTDIIDFLKYNFAVNNVVDLSAFEKENIFLEGTGSLIIDRKAGKVYAALSPRTSKQLVLDVAQKMKLKPILFTATDKHNRSIYHTNVMTTIGNGFAVVCMESIKSAEERRLVANFFKEDNIDVIEISFDQMNHFTGNLLQLVNEKGDPYLVMSSQAYSAFSKQQILQLEKHTNILHSDISTVETIGGGSARCMLAEMFLKSEE